MCGNFFSPSSESFLGGNNPIASVAKLAISVMQPELAPYIYGASAVGDLAKGNYVGAGLNAYGAYSGVGDNSPFQSAHDSMAGYLAGPDAGAYPASGIANASDAYANNPTPWMDSGATTTPYNFGDPAFPSMPGGAEGGMGGAGGGGTPDATFGGMLGQLGNGVSIGDIGGLAQAKMGLSALPMFGGGGGGGVGLPSLMSVGSGLYGMMQADKTRKMMQQYAQAADPFAPYRSGYAAQLKQLTDNPSSIQNIPGYQAGLQAIQRSMGAQGYGGSGNMMTALAKYGGDFYQKQFENLSGLAGVGQNPAAPASIALGGENAANNLAGQSLASIGYGVISPRQRILAGMM